MKSFETTQHRNVDSRMGRARTRVLALGVVTALLATACDNPIGTIDGHTLETPFHAVYGYGPRDEMMVVVSPIPDLCSKLYTGSDPEGDFWVISVWDSSSRLGRGGFVRILSGGTETARQTTSVVFDIRRFKEEDELWSRRYDPATDMFGTARGDISLHFDGGQVLETGFEAEYCSAPLLNGLG